AGHTACIDQAQSLAISRFQAEIGALGAHAAVGVELQRRFHQPEWSPSNPDREHTAFKTEVLMIGTAVVRKSTPTLPRPRLVLDLGSGKSIDLVAQSIPEGE